MIIRKDSHFTRSSFSAFSETGYFCALQSGPKGCNVCLCSSCIQVYETSLCFKDCKADNFLLLQKSKGRNKKRNAKDILQSFPQINHILSFKMSAILKIIYSNLANLKRRKNNIFDFETKTTLVKLHLGDKKEFDH